MTSTAKRPTANRSSAATYKRVPEVLGTTKEVTLAPRGTEEVEGVLAAETRADAEDKDEGGDGPSCQSQNRRCS